MADGIYQHKRGAPGDKGDRNPINTRPPQEYIVIIGGPTNAFNAWWSYVDEPRGALDLSGRGGFWAAQPAPRTLREIDYYVMQKPSKVDDAKLTDATEWQRRGWSRQARDELTKRRWTSNVRAYGPETHDRYWANFIDSAVRLYSQSTPFAAPLRRPAPIKGDIVTFIVYAPAYEARLRIDWRASPYNRDHWNKHGIKGNSLYDPGARRLGPSFEIGKDDPDFGKPATLTEHDKRNLEKLRRDQEEARRNYKDQTLSDVDIDHYILMRTTSENTDKVIKRPPNNYCYFDYLEDRLLNAVKTKGVMTKILFVGHPKQVTKYIGRGTWVGEPRKGMVDESEIEELATKEEARRGEIEKKGEELESKYGIDQGSRYGLENYRFFPPLPVYHDGHGRPLKSDLYWNRLWNGAPAVDRERIKIVRLDYFGHSSDDSMMLDWGWNNAKGQLPNVLQNTKGKYMELSPDDFKRILPGNVAGNAFATLWGCNMGNNFGPSLADYFDNGVVAADTYTDFEKIIHNDTNMPVPADGKPWHRYMPASKGAPVGAK